MYQSSGFPNSGPLNVRPSATRVQFSAQPSTGGLGVTKPNEQKAPLKTEPSIVKASNSQTTKTLDTKSNTVKTQPSKPPPAVQQASNQGTPIAAKKDGIVSSKDEDLAKKKPQSSKVLGSCNMTYHISRSPFWMTWAIFLTDCYKP